MELSGILEELKRERESVAVRLSVINTVLAGLNAGGAGSGTGTIKPRRKMSAAAKARIARAQRARWAAWRKAQKK